MKEYIYASSGEPLAHIDGEITLARKKIIRCMDCEHYEPNMYMHFTCELMQFHVEPDDFCSRGERKENGRQ